MTQPTSNLDTQQQTASTASQDATRDVSQQHSQEEMRRLYLEQQQRLACPGCGEEPFLG
jgi:hypothetical protein